MFDLQDDPDGRRYAAVRMYVKHEGDTATVDFNGVTTLDSGSIPSSEKHPSKRHPDLELPVIATELAATLENAAPSDELTVLGFARGPELDTLQYLRDRAVALGQIETEGDARAFEDAALSLKEEEYSNFFEHLEEDISALGAEVLYSCKHAGCFSMTGSPEAILEVATLDDALVLELPKEIGEMTSNVNGVGGLENVYQTAGFMNHPYVFDGRPAGNRVEVAVMEIRGYPDHPAFYDNSIGWSSILDMIECNKTLCGSVSSWSIPIDSHASASAGLLFGDITQGQDPAHINATARRRRSGSGREASAYLYALTSFGPNTGPSSLAYTVTLDDMATVSPRPKIVSASIAPQHPNSPHSIDPTCLGTDSVARAADEALFENSIFFVTGAGNDSGSGTDCRVMSPGTALGSFAVGGWGGDSEAGSYANLCDMRDAVINPNSSWGGNTTEGRGRTIVDIAGSYWHRECALVGPGYGTRNGTSVAGPAVAGTAVSFYDMYRMEHGAWVDNPAAMFAWMLNMGDRDTTGVHIVEGFDKRFGAGRKNLRMLNDEGLDGPFGVANVEVCVDDGTYVDLDLGTLPGDVDSIRATAYWYQKNFNAGFGLDDIDLELRGDGTQLRYSGTSDNKERVFFRDIGGKHVKLRLHGTDVRDDFSGCGLNSMRVYMTVYYEDDDRDDGNGPSWNPSTCKGVDTW